MLATKIWRLCRSLVNARGASYSLVFRDAEILFLTKIRFVTLRYKNIKKSSIIFITALCSLCSHDQ